MLLPLLLNLLQVCGDRAAIALSQAGLEEVAMLRRGRRTLDTCLAVAHIGSVTCSRQVRGRHGTGSAGSPGRWIPGSLGRRVTKCDPVPSVVRGRRTLDSCPQLWGVQTGGANLHVKSDHSYTTRAKQFLTPSGTVCPAAWRYSS